MARSFTFKSAAYDGRYMEVTCEQTKNVSANTSDITWTLTVTGGASGWYSTGPTTLTINGKQVFYSARKSYSTQAFPAAKGSVSGKITVKHNDADGSCTVPVSLTTAIYTTTLSETGGSWVLDAIDRVSTVSAVSADIGSRSTVVIARKNSAFTHSIAYRFGSLSGYVNADGSTTSQLTKFSATTVNFLLPESFYGQIPNSPTGVCALTCTTWSGDTQIGQPQTAQFTVTAARAQCQPEVSGTVVDANPVTAAMTGDPHKLIRFLSTARCAITAQSRCGATITERRIGGRTVKDTLDIPNADFEAVEFQATDSRGYTVTFKDTPEIIPYIKLTNNATVRRTDPTSGNAELTLQGSCWKGNFGAVENTLTAQYQIGTQAAVSVDPEIGGDSKYTLKLPLTGLDYTKSHSIKVTVRDAAMEVEKTLTVLKGVPVFDWGESDFRFNVPASGDFNGTVNGIYIQTVYLADASSITVQTAYKQFVEGNTGRQSFFVFGSCNGVAVQGLATVWSHGNTVQWSGSGDVSIRVSSGGQILLTMPNIAWGDFILISAKPFSIL